MPDDDQVDRIAADHLQWRGRQGIEWLRERAEIEHMDDQEAALAWQDIAEAADPTEPRWHAEL